MISIPDRSPDRSPDRDLDAEREDLYDRLTRGIAVALEVYAEAALARRRADAAAEGRNAFDLPTGPPGSIEIDCALGFAVELLRGAGDEPLAWLIVEAMALRGGPPRKIVDAIIALRTLHQGGPPPLVETARKAAGAARWIGPGDVVRHETYDGEWTVVSVGVTVHHIGRRTVRWALCRIGSENMATQKRFPLDSLTRVPRPTIEPLRVHSDHRGRR
jgi:hypothetical protein